jgi:hypothetical protein
VVATLADPTHLGLVACVTPGLMGVPKCSLATDLVATPDLVTPGSVHALTLHIRASAGDLFTAALDLDGRPDAATTTPLALTVGVTHALGGFAGAQLIDGKQPQLPATMTIGIAALVATWSGATQPVPATCP